MEVASAAILHQYAFMVIVLNRELRLSTEDVAEAVRQVNIFVMNVELMHYLIKLEYISSGSDPYALRWSLTADSPPLY